MTQSERMFLLKKYLQVVYSGTRLIPHTILCVLSVNPFIGNYIGQGFLLTNAHQDVTWEDNVSWDICFWTPGAKWKFQTYKTYPVNTEARFNTHLTVNIELVTSEIHLLSYYSDTVSFYVSITSWQYPNSSNDNTFNGTDRDNNLRICVIYIYTISWALGMSSFYVTRNPFW